VGADLILGTEEASEPAPVDVRLADCYRVIARLRAEVDYWRGLTLQAAHRLGAHPDREAAEWIARLRAGPPTVPMSSRGGPMRRAVWPGLTPEEEEEIALGEGEP
jgi:hypothetical protein